MENARKTASEKGRILEKRLYVDIGYNIVKFAHSKKEKFYMVVIGSR